MMQVECLTQIGPRENLNKHVFGEKCQHQMPTQVGLHTHLFASLDPQIFPQTGESGVQTIYLPCLRTLYLYTIMLILDSCLRYVANIPT